MQIKYKHLWTLHRDDWVAITTNGDVNRFDRAVMGRGVAYQARNIFPDIDRRLAVYLNKYGNRVFVMEDIRIITFPVKDHWHEPATLGRIAESCHQLTMVLDKGNIPTLYLPKPGCGNGRLKWKDVEPILDELLDERVVVVDYEKKE